VPGVCPNAVTSHGYKGGFKVQMMVKDFTLATNAAKEVGAKLALGDSALGAYKATAEDERCRYAVKLTHIIHLCIT
jgi:3-hydroxyisobutyrate dehydrogenase-like beta-hydroxyacid dehydrogenase